MGLQGFRWWWGRLWRDAGLRAGPGQAEALPGRSDAGQGEVGPGRGRAETLLETGAFWRRGFGGWWAIGMPAVEERFGVRRDCGGMRRLRGKAGERFGQLPREGCWGRRWWRGDGGRQEQSQEWAGTESGAGPELSQDWGRTEPGAVSGLSQESGPGTEPGIGAGTEPGSRPELVRSGARTESRVASGLSQESGPGLSQERGRS